MKIQKTAWRVVKDLGSEPKIWDGAASLTFYSVLSVFPGILVVAAIFSSLSVEQMTQSLSGWWISYLPVGVRELVTGVVQDLASEDKTVPIFSFGFLFLLWSSSSGLTAIMRQMNDMFEVQETRSFVKVRLVSLLIGLLLLLAIAVAIFALIAGEFIIQLLVTGFFLDLSFIPIANLFRYLAAGLVCFAGFFTIYRFAADRKTKWRGNSEGALIASVLFVGASDLYSGYLKVIGGYSTTYGSLGAVIGLLIWLYILSFSLLLGAKWNSRRVS